MKRLYLHIGYPKTGTTAIQEFLYLNRGELLKNGVLYPETGIVKYAHHQIPWVFTKDKRALGDLGESDIVDGLKSEISENGTVDKVVISSEGFVFAMPPESVLAIFKEQFSDIKVVVYLRQPLRWIQSDYNQGVKGWRQLSCTFDEHINAVLSIKKSPMDYYQTLSGWADVFGWDNIIVRTFDMERKGLADGFLDIIGVRDRQGFKGPERVDSNPRLDSNHLELLRVINQSGMKPEDRQWLIDELQSRRSENRERLGDKCREEFGFSVNKKILKIIINSNRRLLKYFDKSLFDSDFFTFDSPVAENSLTSQLNVKDLREVVDPLLSILLDERAG